MHDREHLQLGLHHLLTLPLHDLLRLHGEGLGPVRHGHREGVKPVILGECPLVSGHPRQLEEQLIPLMVFDAVALRAVEVLLHEGLIDHEPVGHSNVNKIKFAEEAYMHLHVWKTNIRKKGYGVQLVKKSLPYFFKNLQLNKILCEPYALNPAPNKVLEKTGFSFVREYITTPGWINYEQPVKRWELTLYDFNKLNL